MRPFCTALLSSILLLQSPVAAPVAPADEAETTCAASAAAQMAISPEPSTEAVSVRLTLWQRYKLYRARTHHQRHVLIAPAPAAK